jgi:L-alanine-DL-glutamate epimerase-like enolase superfamily enzyme
MKRSILKQIIEKDKERQNAKSEADRAEMNDPATNNDRREFLKKAAIGGIALGGLMNLSVEDTIAQTTQKVSRASSPADLKITDLRVAFMTLRPAWYSAIIRIDTNQGIYGIGEVRDGSDKIYALMLKSRLLGKNPCNIEMIFKAIKQFGGHGRQGGGVSGVEMALWDLVGKAYGVPVWQLLGGRFRNEVRLYADTPGSSNPQAQEELIKHRINVQGFTWLKADLSVQPNVPGNMVNNGSLLGSREYIRRPEHPFTQTQITDKGIEEMAKKAERIREVIGWEIPVAADHFGRFDLNNAIRVGRALEKYRFAWIEDILPWYYTDQLKTISDAIETPLCTGEDIYLLDNFMPLLDVHGIDIVHPDLGTAGGILETKRIGDYAEKKGIAMALHQAGTPINFMANVHCAAATQNFLALEHHSCDETWWEGLIKTTDGSPLISKGFAKVPDTSPGLGIELNDAAIKEHLKPGELYFGPSEEWNNNWSHDHLYS